MKIKKDSNTINRRDFLKIGALSTGGILIGFNLFTACSPDVKVPVDISKLDFNNFNAYIKIADNGMVTIFSPNPEIGQGVKTAMPMIIAEELEVAWENVYVQQAALDTKNFKRQVAGGSQSVRKGWDVLRQTGATTRQMLINAAAVRWGVSPDICTANNGIVTNAKGETLGYGELVKEAALLEVPTDIKLKDPKDFKIIGTDVINVDVTKIVTGKPLFGLDYKASGMCYASALRPPAFGQILESFDASKAKEVSGVLHVVQFGNKIAVVAKNTWAAMQGKKALIAKWKDPETIQSSDHINTELDKLLDSEDLKIYREDGKVSKAFVEADKVIEKVFETPFLPHNCMEPMNFYANVTPEKIHLVGPVQTPQLLAKRVTDLLKRKPKDCLVEMTRMGGGFGRRLASDFGLEAAEISSKLKLPIKLIYSREDDMTAGFYKPAAKYKISAAIKDNKIIGYKLKEAVVNSSMFKLVSNYLPAGCVPNLKVETGVYNSSISTMAWRAPYTNFLAFAEESFMDDLANEVGKDPITFRLELLDILKNNPDKSVPYSADRMQGVIKLAVEKSNWGKTQEGVFQGVASYYSHNTHVAEIADIVLEEGLPVVKRVTVAVDCGIVVNPTGAINQIEGSVIDGIGHAMYGNQEMDKAGLPNASNYHKYQLIRMKQTPKVDTYFVKSNIAPTGLGEPALPPAGGAVANAIKAATGQRLLKQPFVKYLEEIKQVG